MRDDGLFDVRYGHGHLLLAEVQELVVLGARVFGRREVRESTLLRDLQWRERALGGRALRRRRRWRTDWVRRQPEVYDNEHGCGAATGTWIAWKDAEERAERGLTVEVVGFIVRSVKLVR